MLKSGRWCQKSWLKPDSDNFAPCILTCKIGGSQNQGKKRYFSKTPFPIFVGIKMGHFGIVDHDH